MPHFPRTAKGAVRPLEKAKKPATTTVTMSSARGAKTRMPVHFRKEQKPDEVAALAVKHEIVFLPPPCEYCAKNGTREKAS
jgi:hypothetical protein